MISRWTYPHTAALRVFSANEQKEKSERFKANQRHRGPDSHTKDGTKK